MSRLYGEQHRALQDRFQTRKLADRAEELVVQTEVGDAAKALSVGLSCPAVGTAFLQTGWDTRYVAGMDELVQPRSPGTRLLRKKTCHAYPLSLEERHGRR